MFPRNVGYEPPHQLSPIVTAILATSTAASPPVERLPRERYDRVSSPFAAERLTRRDTMFLNREDEDGDVPIHIEQSDITVDDALQLGWKFPRATNDATIDTTGFEHQNGHSPHQQRWGGRSESAPQSAVPRSKWEAVVVHPTNHMAQTLVTPAATLLHSRATAPSSVTTLPMHHDVSSVTIPLSSVEAVSFVDAEAWDSGDDDDNRTITAAERGEMAPHGTSEIIEEVNADVHRNAHPTGDATAPLWRLGLPPRSPPPSHSVSLARAVNDSMCSTDADQMAGQQDLQGNIGIASTPSSVSPVSDTTDGSPIKRHYEHNSHVYSSDDDDDTAPGATAAKAHDQSFEAEVLSRRLANLRAEVDHMCFAVFLEASTSPAKESVDHAQHHYAVRTQAPPSPLARTLPPGRRVAARRERTAKRYESPERVASSSLLTPTTQRSQKTHVVSRPAHITTTTAAVVRRTGSPKPSQPRAAVKAAERVNAMKVERLPSPLPPHDMILAPHVAASKVFPYQSTSATDESFRIPLGGTTLQPPAYDDDDEDQYPRSLDDVAFFSSYAKTRMVPTQSTMAAGTLQQDSTVTADSAVGALSTSSPAVVVVRQPLATSKTFAAKKRRNGEIRQNLVDVIPIERVKYNTATHRFPPQEDSSVPLPAVAATIETPKTNSVKIIVKPHTLISSNVLPTERRAEASHSATFSEEFLWTPVKRHEGPSPKEPPQQQQVLSPLQQQHQKLLRKHTKNHQPIITAAPSHTPSPNNNNAVAFDSPRGRNNLQRPNTSSGSNTNTTQSRPMSTFLETSPPHHNASFTNEEQQFVQFPSSTRREESPGMHSANSSITFAERSLSQHSVAAASTTTSTRVQKAPPEQFVEHTNKPHIPSTQHVTSETVDNTASVVQLHDVAPAHITDAMAASTLSASSEIQFELFSSSDETNCDHAKQEEA